MAAMSKLRQDIEIHVRQKGGSSDDAVMVFHDSIISFVKRVFSDRDFELEGSVDGYIFGIARYLWLGELRKKNKNSQVLEANQAVDAQSNIWDTILSEDRRILLKEVMQKLGKNCKSVLMYWAGGYSMQEIADLLGYKSEGMVRKKKHNCWKSLLEWLEEHPSIKEELRMG